MGTTWVPDRQTANALGNLSADDALAIARRFGGDQTPAMQEFRLQIGRGIREIRDWQARVLARRAEPLTLFGMLDEPEPPDITELVTRAARIAGLYGLGRADMRRAGGALLATMRDSWPGQYPEEPGLLEVFGMTAVLRDERQLDITVGPLAPVAEPDTGRAIIIEQTHDTIRWKLVDLYVVSVVTGNVERREGIPVPKRSDRDDRVRWYIPALSSEATDVDSGKGYVAFVDLDKTIDYLETWTNTQRKRIAAAYKWMGSNAGREREREQRVG